MYAYHIPDYLHNPEINVAIVLSSCTEVILNRPGFVWPLEPAHSILQLHAIQQAGAHPSREYNKE
jgi:hypothetical protein